MNPAMVHTAAFRPRQPAVRRRPWRRIPYSSQVRAEVIWRGSQDQ